MLDRYPGLLWKTLVATLAGWLVFAGVAIWDASDPPSNDIAQALVPALIAISALFSLLIVLPIVAGISYWALGQSWAANWLSWAVAGVIGGAAVSGLFGLLLANEEIDVAGRFAMIGAACGLVTASTAYWLLKNLR
jgi:hypothetical protein